MTCSSTIELTLICTSPPLPAAYCEQAYGVIVHGIGVDDESPNIPLPGDPYTEMPEGEFRENMVLAVECYAGKVGARDGVKLEDEAKKFSYQDAAVPQGTSFYKIVPINDAGGEGKVKDLYKVTRAGTTVTITTLPYTLDKAKYK